jgi:hypothetical protein
MKLSENELAVLAAQADQPGGRFAPGLPSEPGSREKPLSYAALVEARRRLLGRE